LEDLDNQLFSGLIRLETLNLSFNQLTGLSEVAFERLERLKSVNLAFNERLKVTGGSYFKGVTLDRVKFYFGEEVEEKEQLSFSSVDTRNFKMASNF